MTHDTRSMLRSLAAVAGALLATETPGATVPAGFQETVVVEHLDQPTTLAFAPDGRLFIAEKTGGIRVVKNGELLADPFLDVTRVIPPPATLDTYYERGLLGIAFDPTFATTPFVYVYYTVCKVPGTISCETAVNRVARVRANGDVADPSSHSVILDDIPSTAGNHNAGWLDFGPLDGKLYVAVGDVASATRAPDLGSLNGKILRIQKDGSVPADNPYANRAGARREVWASGLRNPWRCRFDPDGHLFCADVGADTWEELDVIVQGRNYGWPATEGPFDVAAFPQLVHPIYWYGHDGVRASIIGGDFGVRTGFPGDHQQSYYFGDFVRGWIKRAILDASGDVARVEDFVTGIGDGVTDIVAGPDGGLYYSALGGTVRNVSTAGTNHSPVARASATPASGQSPLTVRFSSAGSSDPDGDALTFGWDFGDGSAGSSAASPQHVYAARGTYTATLTVSDGEPDPGPGRATVTIRVGRQPAVEITSPADGELHRAGDTIPLVGRAVDPDEGELPPSALHWQVIFHHDTHTHPFIDDLVGSPQSFVWATEGEPDPDVGYEVILRAADSTGLTASRSVMVLPRVTRFSLATDPPGLQLTLDGQPVTTPLSVTGVVGFERILGAPSPQELGQRRVAFRGWSDGGGATHVIPTPTANTTYTARFGDACEAVVAIPAEGGTFIGTTEGDSTLSATCSASDRAPERVFAWTPAVSGTATVHTCGSVTDYDTVVSLIGGSCQGGTELACNDDTLRCSTRSGPNHGSRLTPTVTAGQPYFIVVDGYASRRGRFGLTVIPPASSPLPATTTTTTLPPAGTCDSPVAVPAEGGTLTGATTGRGAESGSCGSSGSSGERVFVWIPPRTGMAKIQTCGDDTGYDSVLYVRHGTCDQAAEVGCNDDTAGCPTGEPNDHHGSALTLPVTAGEAYFIAVDGYAGRTGAFGLTVVPPEGSCPDAATIPPGGGVVTGRTSGTSRLSAGCTTTERAPETVFRWTPSRSGVATLETCGAGTNYDTVLYLRRGDCETGAELACSDDGCAVAGNDHWGSRITPTVRAGETYFVVVDGYADRSGAFSLSVVPPP